ncbi:hypothetical protein JOC25_001981 [Solibacillus kalamii]|nr:hypothetical protein [Solibacillus kalamii]
MPCCSFLFWWCAWDILEEKSIIKKVHRIFEISDLLFEKFMHILENPARLLENPVLLEQVNAILEKSRIY